MGVSYIPQDKVFAVCTFQLGPKPQKFSHSRAKANVYYQNNKQPLLTKSDKNLDIQFACKSPVNTIGSLLAFGAGLLLFATGPIGWVIIAAVAVIAIGITIAIVTHKCTDPLKGGQWFLAHNSVKINGSSAITRLSILKCGTGGVLTPFFDEASAIAAAGSIATRNKWELGINVVASFGAGYLLPSTFSGWGAASVGGKIWLGGGRFVVGFLAFSGLNYAERAGIRTYHENAGDLKDNQTYDQMNNHTEIINENGQNIERDIDKNNPWGAPSKPDDLVQDSDDLVRVENTRGTGGNAYKISVLSTVTGMVETYTVYAETTALRRQLNQLDRLSRTVLKNNPAAQQLLTELNAGKHPEWRSAIQNFNQNKMRPGMIDAGRAAMADVAKNNLKKIAKASGDGFLFLLPFVGTWLSEQARADLAAGMARDMAANAGSSIVANTPVD